MKNMGDGRRKVRVEKEVQQIVSQFIISHLKDDIDGLVTVSRVMMPADFRAAQIYVSFFPAQADQLTALKEAEIQKKVVKTLQHFAKDIQDEIGHKLKMRYCPKLTFHYDESTEKILKIEKILSTIAPENIDDDTDYTEDED